MRLLVLAPSVASPHPRERERSSSAHPGHARCTPILFILSHIPTAQWGDGHAHIQFPRPNEKKSRILE
eukprot:scaffold7567_cov104-Isochrysis_galbana.AAC.5